MPVPSLPLAPEAMQASFRSMSQGSSIGSQAGSLPRPPRPQTAPSGGRSPPLSASSGGRQPLSRPQSASSGGRQPPPRTQSASAFMDTQPPKAEVIDRDERYVGPSMGGARGTEGRGRGSNDGKSNLDGMCIQGQSIGVSSSYASPGLSHARSASSAAAGMPGAGLKQIHYQSMRRMAAQREKMQQERDAETERTLEAGRRHRPASAPSGGRNHASAVSPAFSALRQEAGQAASQTEDCDVLGGTFARFLASGTWRPGTGAVDSNGYPIPPRKPFTSIPGYGGYVPKKASESIIGCTYGRGNVLARGSWVGDPIKL